MKDNPVSARDDTVDDPVAPDSSTIDNVSESRRKALSKLAYSSPVIAGLLLSKTSVALASNHGGGGRPLFTPPDPP